MSGAGEALLAIGFESEIIYWRGPSPFFYAPIPMDLADKVREAARVASYGWGCVPVEASIGDIVFTTSLFPKDGTYLLPLKVAVRRKANITAGDVISVEMTINPPKRPWG
ncbi:MAG TPA: DUF1905 domain-containing protein [Caulobacteraceae bacterium]|nr:DUF1905 domain-containing protein [Caulobacteraceae bacterium]